MYCCFRTQLLVEVYQFQPLKVQIFLTFLPESFGDTEKSYTFASAFENERNLKQNELRLDEESVKRKSSLKRFT